MSALGPQHEFFAYQRLVNGDDSYVPSRQVIEASIQKKGIDYRFQDSEHPVPELQNRKLANKEENRRNLALV